MRRDEHEVSLHDAVSRKNDGFEVDASGRCRRIEVFATDRLGDALARLYVRYAELLPDGPARARAAATARSVGVGIAGPFFVEDWARVVAPTIEAVDHRVLGMWSASGAEAVLRDTRSLLEMSEGATLTNRIDAILDVRPDAFLVHQVGTGTSQVGGGTYEFSMLLLRVFGPDGRQTRFELFDGDREEEALARFDELTAVPST